MSTCALYAPEEFGLKANRRRFAEALSLKSEAMYSRSERDSGAADVEDEVVDEDKDDVEEDERMPIADEGNSFVHDTTISDCLVGDVDEVVVVEGSRADVVGGAILLPSWGASKDKVRVDWTDTSQLPGIENAVGALVEVGVAVEAKDG